MAACGNWSRLFSKIRSSDWLGAHQAPPRLPLFLYPVSPSSQSHSIVEDNLEPSWMPQLGQSSGWRGFNVRALSRDSVG